MKAITKNIFREIWKTKSRFMSIFMICAIGVGFFSGVRATCNDMKLTADDYYDSHNLFDLRVLSTFGLTDKDADAAAGIDEVSAVYKSKYTDLAMHKGEVEYLTRVYSINNEVNKIDITDGRAPEAENECVVSYNQIRGGLDVGDTVTMADLTDAEEFPLKYTEYKIVGIFETPMFISLTQRGSTTIGDGSIDAFMYVDENNFTQDVYTELYIKSDRLTDMQSYSEEYEALRDDMTEKLETLGVIQSEIRYDEVIGNVLKEIEDGEKELEQAKIDGQKELDDAKKELDDAKIKIADGEKELADAKAEIDDGAVQLADAEKTLADAKKELDDGWKTLSESREELVNAEKTLNQSKAELDEGEKELQEGLKRLNDSKKQLDDGQKELDKNSGQLAAGKKELEAAKQQLADGQAQYDKGYAEYETGLSEYSAAEQQLALAEEQYKAAAAIYGEDSPLLVEQKAQLEAGKQALAENKLVLDAAAEQLSQSKARLDAAAAEIAANEQTISESEKQLNDAQKEIDNGVAQYNAGMEKYRSAKAELEDGKRQYFDGLEKYSAGLEQYYAGFDELDNAQKEYDDGVKELAEKRVEYENGVKEYEDGVKELEDAKKQYEDGLKEYEDGVVTYNTEIADAEKELADARDEIADAGKAEWYIFNRDDNVGYSEYNSNSERIDKIASIFPVFFLLVAALVCLTTMSRMVEEERTQIGTLKALGYSNLAIMRHYMVYAVTGAILGGIIGAFGGCILFPWVIIFAYSMMYCIRVIHFEFALSNILLSVGSMVLAIGLTVFFSCKKALTETPASLMRPKAPKAGKRVLIEKIGFIWNNMGFFGKVTGRNIFRYKRRMFMTVVGIAGCTALSLTGFGLKDSITDIVNLQYDDIYRYSGYLAYDNEQAGTPDNIFGELTSYNPETENTRAVIKQYSLSFGNKNVQGYITGVEHADIFSGMVELRDRTTHESVPLTNDGAVITEKMSKLLGVSAGDIITVHISDSETSKVRVSGITEQYAGHYAYLTEKVYEDVFGNKPEYNIVYFSNKTSAADDDAFSERMLKVDGVLSVMMNSGASSSFSETVKILDLVIFVLIVSAGALAFVVLYNLTNVNITERIREIATLKVLGFYDREVSSYVFRENIILSIMGAAVGLLLGVALCRFVVTTAELDEVMFGREIHLLSFVWAFLITVAFSLIVNMLMTGVLKKISMVESLKSVD